MKEGYEGEEPLPAFDSFISFPYSFFPYFPYSSPYRHFPAAAL